MAGEALVVADASVVVKWFVEEEYTADAIRLRDDYVDRTVDIASPDLLPYEVLNALRYNPSLDERQLKEIAATLNKYSLWLAPLEGQLAETCIENSMRHRISIYDSAYISLGQIKEALVYTADQKLLSRVGDERVRHISIY
ncbi:type II toxin-antitoxin system VapC family toxin [Candidatus Bathyarchaeota archaeon]|nr:type II toxin-antitoxin system VapC family toxin [Candidatus Bathyarchaeota archaeon]